jgi:adenylosuccinate synthase
MVGWCDCVEKADALRHGGYQDIVINKLDALSPSGGWAGDSLLVCTGYRDPESGKLFFSVPRNDAVRRTLRPVYAELPGWSEDISGARRFADLPVNARRYIAFVMKTTLALASHDGVNVPAPNLRYIGIGPDPEQIIKDVPETDALVKLA